MRLRLSIADSSLAKQQHCRLRHMLGRGSVKFLRDSGNYANKYGDVLTDVMRRKQVLCPVYITGRIVTAAKELGARVGLETHVGGVRGGWAYCVCQDTTYKNQ